MNCYFIIICPDCVDDPSTDPELNEIYTLLNQLFREYEKPAYLRKFEIISSYLNILLIKTENNSPLSLAEEPYNRENFQYFQKFVALLEQDLPHTHKVLDYSKKIGITTRKLSLVCKSCKGKSPKEIINEYLVLESKRLLTSTTYPIKHIASQLGFSDQYQFSKYFKKHEKVSPARYRKKKA
jgi:AraC family transcriptional regulator, transcriptional activator of pobA